MYRWYDSLWLELYTEAKRRLARSNPAVLDRFVAAMDVFRTRPDFAVQKIDRVLDDAAWRQVHATIAALRPDELDLAEAASFGRFVARNKPYFSQLHRQLAPLVSERVGEPVEPTYNFLSLYGAPGVCAPHLDAPSAKWTLDLCVAQSAVWPSHFSQVVPWPEEAQRPGGEGAGHDATAASADWVKTLPSLRFEPVALEPGEAAIFSGSSQWHYRDRMPPGKGRQFCELLFFHYVPAGTRDLVSPARWPALFDAPELDGLSAQDEGTFV
jgi:hypothetical protein